MHLYVYVPATNNMNLYICVCAHIIYQTRSKELAVGVRSLLLLEAEILAFRIWRIWKLLVQVFLVEIHLSSYINTWSYE